MKLRSLSVQSLVRALALGLLAFSAVVAGSAPCLAATLAGWDMNGVTGYGPSPRSATTTDPNLTVGGLTRGAGVGTSGTAAGGGWGGVSWTSSTAAAAVAANQYATFTVAANAGYKASFTAISKFFYRRSGTGADTGVLQYQLGGGAFSDIVGLNYTTSASSGAAITPLPIDLSGITALQDVPAGTTVTFRIVNYRVATGGTATGTWYLYDGASPGTPEF